MPKQVSNVEVNGHIISLSHLDKVFWPQEGYKKVDLIHYYSEAAPYLVPHLQERPLVWTRYPDGINSKGFYQKNAPAHLPDWMNTFTYHSQESDRDIHFILASGMADLVWLANQAALEMHPWLSRTTASDNPDFVVIDLDPSPGNTFKQVVKVAWTVKHVLDELKLRSYIKTSGAEGLHIYIPVQNQYDYKQIRDFAQPVAAAVCHLVPELATIERKVNKRGSLLYVDYLQNARGQTLCAPYSVRPRPGAPVSCPLHWEEIDSIEPAQFTIKTILPRLLQYGDIFAPVLNDKQSLAEAQERLGILATV
ncbi:MAG: non-homologous end-joining DNA ligase [Syntrophomonas sp.]